MSDPAAPSSRLDRLVESRAASRGAASPPCWRCMSSCGPRCRRCSPTISSSTSPKGSRSAANGSSATGSCRRCPGGSTTAWSRYRHARRALSARAARVGDRDLGGVAARARGRRTRHGADRRAGARRHSFFQFLGREIQSRRPAAAAVDAGGAVLLSRARRSAHRRLAARRACSSRRRSGPSTPSRCSCCRSLLFVLMDETARRCLAHARALRRGGAVLRADRAASLLACRAVFLPLQYADARARVATHWHHVVTFPLQWIASQVFFLLPAIALVALAMSRDERRRMTTRASRAATSPCWRSDRSPSPRCWRSCSAGCRSRCGAIRSGRSRRSPR